ncbi:MAG: hypothetical protein U5R31_15250 [Acidimicrobiia bacterium]|nr:hypothetical protein [Acidimicrobiia bacterium]
MSRFAEARARAALDSAGLDMHVPLAPASSVTNEVWLSDDHAIRVNRHPNQRLRREAALAPQLPPEIGYPEIVAYGGDLGKDWLICRRVPGLVLSRCWHSMTRDERREVVRQLAERLRHIDAFEVPADLPPIDAPQLLGGEHCFSPVDPLVEALERVGDFPHVDARLIREAQTMVRKTAYALDPLDDPHTGPRRPDLREPALGRIVDQRGARLRVGPGARPPMSTSTSSCGSVPIPSSTSRRTTKTSPWPRTTPMSRGGSPRTIPSSSTSVTSSSGCGCTPWPTT